MRGSLAKARVVYLPVKEINNEGRLLRACRILFRNQSHLFFLVFDSWNLISQLTGILISLAFLEVIIDAFVKAGLVMEKDANQSLKVKYVNF